MISLDRANFQSVDAAVSSENVRSIWSYVLEKAVRQGGHFSGPNKTEKFEELVGQDARLYPGGIPDRDRKRELPGGVMPPVYASFHRKVSVRSIPTPISDLYRPRR